MKAKLLTSFLLASVFLALASTAMATTWYVNGVSGSDTNNCLLASTACKTIGHAISLASSGDSVIVAAATYTERLGFGISLKVIGSGASTTIIDGGRLGKVVTIGSGIQVTLSGLTLRNGYVSASWKGCCQKVIGGSGIYNNGMLTLSRSTVSGNTVSATVTCSLILGCGGGVFGGGIYNLGTVTINNSTVSGNVASIYGCSLKQACVAYGGGIFNQGKLIISKSTINGNGVGGTQSLGGGIDHNAGTLTIINSTVSGNSNGGNGFGGGIYNNGATASASNTTLSGNSASHGGNIAGSLTIQNSIIANSAFGGNCSGGLASYGYNLSSDGTCNLSGPGDLNNTDPKLGTLGHYGGPTQTVPLLSGSPAIDAGNPTGCRDSNSNLLKTDQRGKPRPDPEDTGGCDIGAYESQSD